MELLIPFSLQVIQVPAGDLRSAKWVYRRIYMVWGWLWRGCRRCKVSWGVRGIKRGVHRKFHRADYIGIFRGICREFYRGFYRGVQRGFY